MGALELHEPGLRPLTFVAPGMQMVFLSFSPSQLHGKISVKSITQSWRNSFSELGGMSLDLLAQLT